MSDNNIPGYTNKIIDTNLILRQFPDGGYQVDDNFNNLFNLSPAEFNRLAMQAPLVKRMVEYIQNRKNECEHYFCSKCLYSTGCHIEPILAEIAELEKPA